MNNINKKPFIYFDLDGTLVDLYNTYKCWDRLRGKDHTLFIDAKPLFNLSGLSRILKNLQKKGYKVGIITWLSMYHEPDFNKEIKKAKRQWIDKHFKKIKFDAIHYLPFGTDKDIVAKKGDILFDDDINARRMWNKGKAYTEKEIFTVLKKIIKAKKGK